MSDEIVPDGKDWTWVLEARCPECGFDGVSMNAPDVSEMIEDNVASFEAVLRGPVYGLRARPNPTTWSPLEYAAHVRDVYRIFLERLNLMLTEDDPLFANWDQDVTALAERYNEQDPAAVAAELRVAGEAIAIAFDGLDPDDWGLPGRRSDGASFTIESFARYLIHDPIHHLHDVRSS